jgi:very-short-patch-repair endonuclease
MIFTFDELLANIGKYQGERIEDDATYFQKLAAFKRYYEKATPGIFEAHNKNKSLWFSSYPFDWIKHFSPIERDAWNSIRSKGHIVLYPQFPVLNYFLDFANPPLKIALELDGEKYHNKTRDQKRDQELRSEGWMIYRITGKEMMRTNYQETYELQERLLHYEEDVIDDLRYWLLETGDGVIEAIKAIYFDDMKYPEPDQEINDEKLFNGTYPND